jgi:hypothetical protein
VCMNCPVIASASISTAKNTVHLLGQYQTSLDPDGQLTDIGTLKFISTVSTMILKLLEFGLVLSEAKEPSYSSDNLLQIYPKLIARRSHGPGNFTRSIQSNMILASPKGDRRAHYSIDVLPHD